LAIWNNADAPEPPSNLTATLKGAHHDSGRGSADWSAYLRMLDGIDTSYRN
jgi:hypothetical protein